MNPFLSAIRLLNMANRMPSISKSLNWLSGLEILSGLISPNVVLKPVERKRRGNRQVMGKFSQVRVRRDADNRKDGGAVQGRHSTILSELISPLERQSQVKVSRSLVSPPNPNGAGGVF